MATSAALFVATSAPSWSRADDAVARGADARSVAPLPEPIFTETVSDLDGDEAGEPELEANASVLRARRRGAYRVSAAAEAEWLATRRLGLRLEPSFARTRTGRVSVARGERLQRGRRRIVETLSRLRA